MTTTQDEQVVNAAVWKRVKGVDSGMPAPRFDEAPLPGDQMDSGD